MRRRGSPKQTPQCGFERNDTLLRCGKGNPVGFDKLLNFHNMDSNWSLVFFGYNLFNNKIDVSFIS